MSDPIDTPSTKPAGGGAESVPDPIEPEAPSHDLDPDPEVPAHQHDLDEEAIVDEPGLDEALENDEIL